MRKKEYCKDLSSGQQQQQQEDRKLGGGARAPVFVCVFVCVCVSVCECVLCVCFRYTSRKTFSKITFCAARYTGELVQLRLRAWPIELFQLKLKLGGV